jgi:hypothetical protein
MQRENYHLRELKSVRYQDQNPPLDFRQFAADQCLPLIKLAGYKLPEKRQVAIHCLHNLVLTGLECKCVADTRNTHEPGVRFRVEVWNAIMSAGLAHACPGSQEARKVTRYRADAKLLDLRKEWELRELVEPTLARNTGSTAQAQTRRALVCLHTGKYDPLTGRIRAKALRNGLVPLADHIRGCAQRARGTGGGPDPRAVANGLEHFRGREDRIDRINSHNLKFAWRATNAEGRAIPVNPCLREVHVGSFFRAMRLYGYGGLSGQHLPKRIRRKMLIGGEPVAELDYKCMAPRMLYHAAGSDPHGDIYWPSKIFPSFHESAPKGDKRRAVIRGFVKRATMICLNVATKAQANAAVSGLLKRHPESAFLREVIYDIEGWGGPKAVVEHILQAHRRISDKFFTEAGARLMTQECQIMLAILDNFVEAGRPALGLHDAVLCRAADVPFAMQVMRDVYQLFVRLPPVVERAF